MTQHTHEPSSSDITALSVRVGALESDIREFGDRLLGLDTKIDKAISGLATEFRASFSAITSQLSERQRTPWAVLISGAGFIVAVLGVFGSQALSPLQADTKLLKEQIVPREEINYRTEASNRRFQQIESAIAILQQRAYDEMRDELRDLRNENRDLKRGR